MSPRAYFVADDASARCKCDCPNGPSRRGRGKAGECGDRTRGVKRNRVAEERKGKREERRRVTFNANPIKQSVPSITEHDS